jgi:hypothetical protein
MAIMGLITGLAIITVTTMAIGLTDIAVGVAVMAGALMGVAADVAGMGVVSITDGVADTTIESNISGTVFLRAFANQSWRSPLKFFLNVT